MRALITGAAGFVGRHLARELSAAGWTVVGAGLSQPAGTDAADLLAHGVPVFVEMDVTDRLSVRRALDASEPDAVFHLAGIASVAAAERDRSTAFKVNSMGALVLLDEILARRVRTGADPVCLLVGSGEQYGRHDDTEMPLQETAVQRPMSAYAASKCAQETIALQMQRSNGLRVVCARSFNHSGAGQNSAYLLPALVARAVALRDKGGDTMPVGNTSPVRDYLHVEDVARAYRLLVERGTLGEAYNVCSGLPISVSQLARSVLDRVGVSATLVMREDLVRPVDVPILVGSMEKLQRATGWAPARKLNDILEDLILAASN